MTTVIGLDLSLNGSAGVAAPDGWKPGDWAALEPARWPPPKGKVGAERLHYVAQNITNWIRSFETATARDVARAMGGKGEGLRVYVEDYAFAASVTSARAVAELVGCVKRDLWLVDVDVVPVAMNSARKLLLGHVPSRKKSGVAVKDFVNEKIAKMGADFKTMDEGDAFVVMNYGLSLLGLPHIGVGETK